MNIMVSVTPCGVATLPPGPLQMADREILDIYSGYWGNKNPERTKVASTALQEDIDLSKASGRKPSS